MFKLICNAIIVLAFVGILPAVAFANGGDDHGNNEAPVIKTTVSEDDFIGDGHTDHTHAPIVKGPWYQDQTWWALFIGSLLFMTVLSWGVWRYLQVKEQI